MRSSSKRWKSYRKDITAYFGENIIPIIQPHGNMMEKTGTGYQGIKDITGGERSRISIRREGTYCGNTVWI